MISQSKKREVVYPAIMVREFHWILLRETVVDLCRPDHAKYAIWRLICDNLPAKVAGFILFINNDNLSGLWILPVP
jgi:hypothetical protein